MVGVVGTVCEMNRCAGEETPVGIEPATTGVPTAGVPATETACGATARIWPATTCPAIGAIPAGS